MLKLVALADRPDQVAFRETVSFDAEYFEGQLLNYGVFNDGEDMSSHSALEIFCPHEFGGVPCLRVESRGGEHHSAQRRQELVGTFHAG